MNKRIFKAVLSVIVIIGIAALIVGCSNPSGSGDGDNNNNNNNQVETYLSVASLSDLNGTWKGSGSKTGLSLKEEVELYVGETWTGSIYEATYGDIQPTEKYDITLIIDATAQTRAWPMTRTTTYSGGKIAEPGVWDAYKSLIGLTWYESNPEQGGTVDNTAHIFTRTDSGSAQPLSQNEITNMVSGFQISKDKKKIKMPANYDGNDYPEIIMTKQQ